MDKQRNTQIQFEEVWQVAHQLHQLPWIKRQGRIQVILERNKTKKLTDQKFKIEELNWPKTLSSAISISNDPMPS